jgi:hypothetical protein
MKRPRIALCLLMALFASSLYAVGFAADRENLVGRPGATDWAAEEADLCEHAYQGYCEYAYERPIADPYDACTAGDDDSGSTADDVQCQAYSSDIDRLETPFIDDEETNLSDAENASVEAPAFNYQDAYTDYDYTSAEDLAENPEPQDFDTASWRRRYCLAREVEAPVAQSLPAGAIRDFVERVSDALVQLLNASSSSAGAVSAWQLEAVGPSRLPLSSGLGLLDGSEWSAANSAVAARANRWVIVESWPLPAENLALLVGPPQPVTLRDLARPLARLAVGVRNRWQAAWNEIGELATEGDEVPEVSSRPQSETASPPSDPGRDTRTSLRRNPRRVEI